MWDPPPRHDLGKRRIYAPLDLVCITPSIKGKSGAIANFLFLCEKTKHPVGR